MCDHQKNHKIVRQRLLVKIKTCFYLYPDPEFSSSYKMK